MNNALPDIRKPFEESKNNSPFDPNSRKWSLSRDVLINLSWIDDFIQPSLHPAFLGTLTYYARKYSAGHTNNIADRFREFSRFTHANRGCFDNIMSIDIINYRASLDRNNEWYLGVIRGFIKSWVRLGYPGIESEVISLFDGWRLKGNPKGVAIQTLCPEKGALSDLEFEALHQTLVDSFQSGQTDLNDFALLELFLATGRRPAQVGDLKAKDFIKKKSQDGLTAFIVNIPRRKQKNSHWRGEFKPFALITEIGVVIDELIEKNKKIINSLVKNLSPQAIDELPIFPNWRAIEIESENTSLENIHSFLSSENSHITTNAISRKVVNLISELDVQSERTSNGKLHVFPMRLRRTLATRAAREGFGELVIAELLDHSDTQNARVYTENVPEHVDAINKAMAHQLAPLAQAFAGVLVDAEKDAVRGNDLSSRVRSEQGNVGTCGHHGFCGALAPIACYTCRNFQPWLDGPHEEVLDKLLADREKILAITNDKTMAAVNDRTIFAVTQVIQQCEKRQAEIQRKKLQ